MLFPGETSPLVPSHKKPRVNYPPHPSSSGIQRLRASTSSESGVQGAPRKRRSPECSTLFSRTQGSKPSAPSSPGPRSPGFQTPPFYHPGRPDLQSTTFWAWVPAKKGLTQRGADSETAQTLRANVTRARRGIFHLPFRSQSRAAGVPLRGGARSQAWHSWNPRTRGIPAQLGDLDGWRSGKSQGGAGSLPTWTLRQAPDLRDGDPRPILNNHAPKSSMPRVLLEKGVRATVRLLP